jgi:hypothetical protein
MSRATVIAALGGLWLAGAGCQSELDGTVSRTKSAISMGTPDGEFPGVCGITTRLPRDPDDPDTERDPQYCSCTLVADRIVLTAAHCLEENTRADVTCNDGVATGPCLDDIDIRFGSSFGAGTRQELDDIRIHRYFDPDIAQVNDIAMVRLTVAPAQAPVTLNDQPLSADLVGESILLVGFGITEADLDDFGLRRQVDATVSSILPEHLVAGNADFTSCRGDNGGPGFYDFGAGPAQVVLNSTISGCNPNARKTRVDAYTAEFIYPFIDSYIGPCALDGACVETGCRSPDPDCDVCSQDGVCEEDCDTRDFDCPLGVFPGGDCTDDGQCELGGRCIAAQDDPDYLYCSQPCDPTADDPECPAAMACTDLGGGAGECEFTVPSPGSQGYPCDVNNQCRSSICEEGICVIECSTDADCPDAPAGEDPYTCVPSRVVDGASVCIGRIITGGGGFCAPSVAGRTRAGTTGGLAVLFLAALAIVFTGRRRRRR